MDHGAHSESLCSHRGGKFSSGGFTGCRVCGSWLYLTSYKIFFFSFVCLFLQYVLSDVVDHSNDSSATVSGHMTSTFPLLHSVSVVDPWVFPRWRVEPSVASVSYVGEGGRGSSVQWIVALESSKERKKRMTFVNFGQTANDLLIILLLTVSHLALARSSSNLANSRRSWMVISSFQMSSATRPRSRMAPATARSTTRMSGPSAHSEPN